MEFKCVLYLFPELAYFVINNSLLSYSLGLQWELSKSEKKKKEKLEKKAAKEERKEEKKKKPSALARLCGKGSKDDIETPPPVTAVEDETCVGTIFSTIFFIFCDLIPAEVNRQYYIFLDTFYYLSLISITYFYIFL